MSAKTINKLSDLNGVSGHEREVRKFLVEELSGLVSSFDYDNLGSVIAKVEGRKPGVDIAIVGHMDEVGFLVRRINDDGTLTLINIGGVDLDTLNNTKVTVNGFDGVLLLKLVNDKKVIELKNFIVDLGFTSKEQVVSANIKIGDGVYFKNDFTMLQNNLVSGKAMDDRLGVAALIEIAKKINNDLEYGNVYLCGSVQEEVGLRGAKTVAACLPDSVRDAIIIDVSPVTDFYNKESCSVGGGPLVRVQDPSMIFQSEITGKIRQIASDNQIVTQDYFSLGGTDSNIIEISKDGFRVGAICIGARSLHAANTIISLDDFNNACQLAYLYILEITRGLNEK